jgi:lactoylglutathione lyase
MTIKKLEHVGVMVSDLEVSIDFYENVLGLDLLDRFAANETTGLAFLGDRASGQVIVELICGKDNRFPDEGKVHHIAFTVDHIEEEMERLRKLKVHFTSDEFSILANGNKYIFFKGPDGETLELFQSVSE